MGIETSIYTMILIWNIAIKTLKRLVYKFENIITIEIIYAKGILLN